MTSLVHIEPGQWCLAYIEHHFPDRIDRDLRASLEMLVEGGSGWDSIDKPEHQFQVVQVHRVMPKTFLDVDGARRARYLVIAAAGSAGELIALRDKLFLIGFEADRLIEAEISRLIHDFAAKTRADALSKVHAALPHIFGRSA